MKFRSKAGKYYGNIFLVDDDTNQITSIKGVYLTIKDKKIFVDAGGHFFCNQSWKLINGEFNGLDEVSLLNCYASGRSQQGYAGSTSRINVHTVAEGSHYKSYEEVKTFGMKLYSSVLDRWIQHRGRIEEIEPWTFKVQEKEEIVNFETDDITVVVNSISSMKRLNSRSINIKGETTIILKSDTAKHIDDFNNLYVRIKKLILFLTNKNPEYDEVYLLDEEQNESDVFIVKRNLKEKQFSQNIKLYYLPIRSQINAFFKKWVEDKSLDMILDLIMERQYNTSISSASYFFNICVALESFHDKLNPKATKEKEKIVKPIVKSIKAKLEGEQASLAMFKEQSSYWAKLTFQEKLEFYKTTLITIAGEVFLLENDTLLTDIKKTRNAIAHQGDYYKFFNKIEIFLVGKLLEFTLKIEVLKYLAIEMNNDHRSPLKAAKAHFEALAILNKYYKKPASEVIQLGRKKDRD